MSFFAIQVLVAYIISILAVCLSRFHDLKVGKFFAHLSAFLAFITVANRPESFPDVDSYENMFKVASTGNFSDRYYWLAHGEPGFKIVSYLLYKVGFGFRGFLGVMSSLSYYLLIRIAKVGALSFSFLWFVYFSFFLLTRDAGVIRLAISAHLIILFVLSTKWARKSQLLFISFSTFQYFSVVIALNEFAKKFRPNIMSFLILILFAFSVSIFLNFSSLAMFFPEKQSDLYDGSYHLSSGVSPIPIIRNGIYFLVVYYLYYSQKIRQSALIWSSFLSVFMYILFSGVLVVAQRFSAYFGAVLVLSLALKMSENRLSIGNFLFISIFSVMNFISVFVFNDFVWRN